jgi:PAS domain S-box-containing protein
MSIVAVSYFGLRYALLRRFSDLETRSVQREVERVSYLVEQDAQLLEISANDWGAWDDTHESMKKLDSSYARSNLSDEIVRALDLDLLVILDDDGNSRYTYVYDRRTHARLSHLRGFDEHTGPRSVLSRGETPASGFLVLPEGILEVAVHPIPASGRPGSIRGSFVIGKFLSRSRIDQLGRRAGISLDIRAVGLSTVSRSTQDHRSDTAFFDPARAVAINEDTVAGFGSLRDLYGAPILRLEIRLPRDIYKNGIASIQIYLLLLTGFGLLVGFGAIFAVNRVVISRVAALADRVMDIGKRRDASARVDVNGKDEISDLASEVNKMLESLEESGNRLDDARRQLELIVENQGEAIVVFDLDGGLRYCNPMGEILLGLCRTALAGRNLRDYLARDEFIDLMECRPSIVAGKSVSRSFRVTSCRADPRHLLAVFTASRDGDGTVNGILGVFRDETERVRAEKALRDSEERFRRVVESVNDIVFTLDPQLRFTGLFGIWPGGDRLETDTVVGKTLTAALGGITEDMHEEEYLLALSGEPQIHESLLCLAGREFWYEVSVSPLRDGDGGIVGVVGVARDITDQKRLERELRQSQKVEAIGRLAGGIAHDFNNILTVIGGYTEVLLAKSVPGHQDYVSLAEIARTTARASDLTKQLLAFSRQSIVRMEVLNLNDRLTELSKMIGRVIGENISISMLLDRDLWNIRSDSGQMEQVVVNLAVNARDAMPHGGNLEIETSNTVVSDLTLRGNVKVPGGEYVVLRMTDNGCGMDEATQSQVFEPFFSTKGDAGTGLGLCTVYGIVRRFDGYVSCYSEVGVGTTFKVYLPAEHGPMETIDVNQLDDEQGGDETILAVEDEPSILDIVSLTLREKGYTVLTASDGEGALDIVNSYVDPIHLLLTDMVLPDTNGGALAEEVRARRPDVRVVYTSGYTDEIIVHQGVLHPGIDFLQKPFHIPDLRRLVRQVLDRSVTEE